MVSLGASLGVASEGTCGHGAWLQREQSLGVGAGVEAAEKEPLPVQPAPGGTDATLLLPQEEEQRGKSVNHTSFKDHEACVKQTWQTTPFPG